MVAALKRKVMGFNGFGVSSERLLFSHSAALRLSLSRLSTSQNDTGVLVACLHAQWAVDMRWCAACGRLKYADKLRSEGWLPGRALCHFLCRIRRFVKTTYFARRRGASVSDLPSFPKVARETLCHGMRARRSRGGPHEEGRADSPSLQGRQ